MLFTGDQRKESNLKSFDGERSYLFFFFLKLLEWNGKIKSPIWLLFENKIFFKGVLQKLNQNTIDF